VTAPRSHKWDIYLVRILNVCYVVAGFGSISADRAISNTEVHQNTVFIKQRDIILTNDVWTVIVNLDFSSYEQAVTKLRDDLLYIQKFKTPLAPVHELNHIVLGSSGNGSQYTAVFFM